MGKGGGGGMKKDFEVECTVRRAGRELSAQNLKNIGYLSIFVDEPMNIRSLCLSVDHTFLGCGTEKYITIIFLDIDEDTKIEECFSFSCSVRS
jgi:hypothetical protein